MLFTWTDFEGLKDLAKTQCRRSVKFVLAAGDFTAPVTPLLTHNNLEVRAIARDLIE